jgi:hypothetical protein
MKKIIYVLLDVALLVVLSSCDFSVKPTFQSNSISVADLTKEQQDILGLLTISNSQEILIFDFNTDEVFSNVEFWVEVYENGEMINSPAGLTMVLDDADTQSGNLAVIINRNPHYQWTLSVSNNGSRSSHISSAETVVDSALSRSYGPIDEPVLIEDGKEIILYSSLFTTGSMNVYNHMTLQEYKELLSEFAHAHIVKCAFNK